MTLVAARDIVFKIYIGYLNRVPGKDATDYWANDLINNPSINTEQDLAIAIANSPEYTSLYGNLSRSDLVTKVYSNLFNRVPTQAAITYWDITSGVPTNLLIEAILTGAQSSDLAIITNKIEVADYAYNSGISTQNATLLDISSVTEDSQTVNSITGTIDSFTNVTTTTNTTDIQPTVTSTSLTSDGAKEIVARAYIIYFNRVAETSGANYWVNELINNPNINDESDLSISFSATEEYSNLYGSLSRTSLITSLYNNLFDRVPTAEEITYWDTTAVPNVLLPYTIAKAATGVDGTTLRNKVLVSLYAYNNGISGTDAPTIDISTVTDSSSTISNVTSVIDSLGTPTSAGDSSTVDTTSADVYINNPTSVNIKIEDFTTGTLDGQGVFDKLMKSVNAQLEEQYNQNRITGPDYATVYLGSIQSVMSESMKFILTSQEEEAKTSLTKTQANEITLNGAKDRAFKDEQTLNEADKRLSTAKAREVQDAQKALYERQTVGYDDNKHIKVFEAQLNSWALLFSSGIPNYTQPPTPMTDKHMTEAYNSLAATQVDTTNL